MFHDKGRSRVWPFCTRPLTELFWWFVFLLCFFSFYIFQTEMNYANQVKLID